MVATALDNPLASPSASPSPSPLAVPWSPAERAAWRPPERLKPSAWAERNRRLAPIRSSRPGPWKNRRQPIMAPLLDLAVRRAVREIWEQKPAQAGGSEKWRNFLAYLAHQRPAGVLWVMPNKEDGEKQIKKYLRPLFDGTDVPALLELRSDRKSDNTLKNIRLINGFDLQLAWGGSPASLSAEPRKIVFLDEVDKFLAFTGVEANAVDLARQRLHTFGRSSLLVAVSTPTTPDGAITRGREACPIQLRYYVACPHCAHEHTLDWDNLVFEKFREHKEADGRPASPGLRAALIRAKGAAWMKCPNPECGRKIDEKHKEAMLLAGYWGTPECAIGQAGWRLYYDGREEGEKPLGDAIGVQYSRLYDMMCSWAEVAAAFVAAEGDLSKLIDFYNGWLGEPFKDLQQRVELSVIERKCLPNPETGFRPHPARLLPAWVGRLVMSIDTQKDHFYWLVRGWGAGRRSIRVDHGIAHSFDALEAISDGTRYRYVDDAMPARGVYCCGIDTGGGMDGKDPADASRTEQVIAWCNRDPLRRLALKGSSKPLLDVIKPPKKQQYTPPGGRRPSTVYFLHFIDALRSRDLLAGMITATFPVVDPETGEQIGEQDLWCLNDINDPVYNRQMTNVQRVRQRKAGKITERWVEKTVGARSDYHDVESYNLAMAYGPAACLNLPTEAEMLADAKRAMARQQLRDQRGGQRRGIRTPDGREYLANHRE